MDGWRSTQTSRKAIRAELDRRFPLVNGLSRGEYEALSVAAADAVLDVMTLRPVVADGARMPAAVTPTPQETMTVCCNLAAPRCCGEHVMVPVTSTPEAATERHPKPCYDMRCNHPSHWDPMTPPPTELQRETEQGQFTTENGSELTSEPVPNQVRPSDVLVIGARITPDVVALVRAVERALAAAVGGTATQPDERVETVLAYCRVVLLDTSETPVALAQRRMALNIIRDLSGTATPADQPDKDAAYLRARAATDRKNGYHSVARRLDEIADRLAARPAPADQGEKP